MEQASEGAEKGMTAKSSMAEILSIIENMLEELADLKATLRGEKRRR